MMYLKLLEMQKQIKLKNSRSKENNKLRTEINEIETIKTFKE
jgi:hypothetical protein